MKKVSKTVRQKKFTKEKSQESGNIFEQIENARHKADFIEGRESYGRSKVKNLLAELKQTLDAIQTDRDFIRYKAKYENTTDFEVKCEAEASVYGLMNMELRVVKEIIKIIEEEKAKHSG